MFTHIIFVLAIIHSISAHESNTSFIHEHCDFHIGWNNYCNFHDKQFMLTPGEIKKYIYDTFFDYMFDINYQCKNYHCKKLQKFFFGNIVPDPKEIIYITLYDRVYPITREVYNIEEDRSYIDVCQMYRSFRDFLDLC